MRHGALPLPVLLAATFAAVAWAAAPLLEEHRAEIGGDTRAGRPGRPSPAHSHLSPSLASASLQQSAGQEDARANLVRREAPARTAANYGAGHPFIPSPNISMDSRMGTIIQSSPSSIELDGKWTTASGLNLTISGEDVAGQTPSGYHESIKISDGGRRVEMHVPEEGVRYWADLSGRGSLNWNDGDVWSRPIDCAWQTWAIFGACGGPCPQGMQQRRRDFEYLQENGGSPCSGPKEECREAKFCKANSTFFSNLTSSLLESDPAPAPAAAPASAPAAGSSGDGNSSSGNSSNNSGATLVSIHASVVFISALLGVGASSY